MSDFESLIDLMHPFLCVMIFILGTTMGSFLECLGDRHAHGKSIIKKERSFCPACGHDLGALDLIPVVSYLALRGRCRYCKARIPVRHLVCELLLGTGYLAVYLVHGISFEALRCVILISFMLPAAVADLEVMEVSDAYWIIGSVLIAATIPFSYVSFNESVLPALIGGIAIPAAMMFIALIMEKILKKDALGGADIKLLFMAGLCLGTGRSIFNIILMCFTGLILSRIIKMKDGRAFPLVPAIAISSGLSCVFGGAVITWYLGLFGL